MIQAVGNGGSNLRGGEGGIVSIGRGGMMVVSMVIVNDSGDIVGMVLVDVVLRKQLEEI